MDFSQLTSDQLVELIRAACAECAQRGVATAAAANAAMMDEAEKARIAHHAAAAEADKLKAAEAAKIAKEAAETVRRQADSTAAKEEAKKQQELWAKKTAVARKAKELFGDGMNLNVWMRDSDKEKRVYVQEGMRRKQTTHACYYATGNARNKPGSIELETRHSEKKAEIAAFCADLAKRWNTLKIDCDAALAGEAQ